MTLHTNENCEITKTDDFTGNVGSDNCDVNAPGQAANQGCSITTNLTNTYGTGFNAASGGVYATEWTSEAIKIWHFARSAIPADINVSYLLDL
jgi:hypothetical protein